MFDANMPIVNNVVVGPVLPSGKPKSGGRVPSKSIDLRGRVINVRNGRQRPRRFSPIAYGGANRRLPHDQRRAVGRTDNSGDRVVTLLVPAGADFDKLIGREVFLKVSK